MQKMIFDKKAEENSVEKFIHKYLTKKQCYANKNVKLLEILKKVFRKISLKTYVNLYQKRINLFLQKKIFDRNSYEN